MSRQTVIGPRESVVYEALLPLDARLRRLFGRCSEIAKRAKMITDPSGLKNLTGLSWAELADLMTRITGRHHARSTLATWAGNCRRAKPLAKYKPGARIIADVILCIRAFVGWLSRGKLAAHVVPYTHRVRVYIRKMS